MSQLTLERKIHPMCWLRRLWLAIAATGLNVSAKSTGNRWNSNFGKQPDKVFTDSSGITQSVEPVYTTYLRVPDSDMNGLQLVHRRTTILSSTWEHTLVFEFDSNGVVGTNKHSVGIAATTDGLAAAIVLAINGANLGLAATFTSGGMIAVGDQSDLRLQATSTALEVVGAAGRTANNAIPIDVSTVSTAVKSLAHCECNHGEKLGRCSSYPTR